jgi:hypothetical protein
VRRCDASELPVAREPHPKFPLSCRIFGSQLEAHIEINAFVGTHLWGSGLLIHFDDDLMLVSDNGMVLFSIGLR